MTTIEIIFLALGLAMDAFAVAVTIGLGMIWFDKRKAVIVGVYFGVFQAVMPVIGYVFGGLFADFVAAFGDWIAFGVLVVLGGKMAWGGFINEEASTKGEPLREVSVGVVAMLPLALATSIDAMAVGVSFAFLYVDIVFSAVVIGVVTFAMSVVGVKIGNAFGIRYKNKAELTGGLMLILIGIRILVF